MLSALLALFLVAPQEPAARPPAVDSGNYLTLLSQVVPTEEELRWRAIPWRATLRDGLSDGAAAGKPVLLWAMNGHPLGST